MSRHRTRQEARTVDRHVRLYLWVMRTAAWKSLAPTARALYAELARHYNGKNNGRIGYSIRQAAADLGISLSFASKMFAVLQERGFIVAMQKGAFFFKKRHATEWRLTEFICDVTGQVPSKDFAHWQPAQNLEYGTARRSKTHLTILPGEAWVSETPLYASLHSTVEGAPASPRSTLLVNQGVAAAAAIASPALAAVVRRKGWVNDH